MSPRRRRERFDPYAILHALERERVTYIVVGALACVIQGSDEVTQGLDITPSPRAQNLERLERALESLNARRVDVKQLDLTEAAASGEPVIALETDRGEVKVAFEPAGTRGYDDLRRRAIRQHLGEGLRPQVAAPGDLVRMLEALGRERDALAIETMQRVVELDRGLTREW